MAEHEQIELISTINLSLALSGAISQGIPLTSEIPGGIEIVSEISPTLALESILELEEE